MGEGSLFILERELEVLLRAEFMVSGWLRFMGCVRFVFSKAAVLLGFRIFLNHH
jgi:hypothetical protein